jgi:H+/Cl- antiporter ClcA
MLETTNQINFFIPVGITVLVANFVGNMFNQSIYDIAIRNKQLPVLRPLVPES